MGWTFTDGMFVGKVVPIEDYSELEEGDIVVIREDLVVGEDYDGEDAHVEEDMLKYQGKVALITYNHNDGDFDIDVDNDDFFWGVGMFSGKVVKPVVEEEVEDSEPMTDEEPTEVEAVEEKMSAKDPKANRAIEDYKYKVGDKVRILDDLEEGHYEAEKLNDDSSTMYFNPKMDKYSGMEATVIKVNTHNGTYTLDIDKEDSTGQWVWSIGMLEEVIPPVREAHTLNAMAQFGLHIERVIFSEPATILFYRVPDIDPFSGLVLSMSNTKKVVAKCIEGDTFDKDTGLNVALYKALIKEATKQLRKI
jgi:hypothetical protein